MYAGNNLCESLATLFNACVATRSIPHSWLRAIISPIPKADRTGLFVKDYRPIALLSVVFRLFERVLLTLFVDLLHFDPNMFGSSKTEVLRRPWRSSFVRSPAAQMPLSRGSMGTHGMGCVPLQNLTFPMLFVASLYNLALCELLRQGVPRFIVETIRSFFVGRTASVRVGDCLSPPFDILWGVSQGSVLGPVLFALLSSPLVSLLRGNSPLSRLSVPVCFADDLLLVSGAAEKSVRHSIVVAVERLQPAANILLGWCSRVGIEIGLQKTEVRYIGAPTIAQEDAPQASIKLGDNEIAASHGPFSFLGLRFSAIGSLIPHANHVCEKLHAAALAIKEAFLPPCSKRILADGLGLSHLRYAHGVFLPWLLSEGNSGSYEKVCAALSVLARAVCGATPIGSPGRCFPRSWLRVDPLNCLQGRSKGGTGCTTATSSAACLPWQHCARISILTCLLGRATQLASRAPAGPSPSRVAFPPSTSSKLRGVANHLVVPARPPIQKQPDQRAT